MNCKLGKLEIPADQPFLNCKLGREKYAEVLKAIITTYKKGFVLAIDGNGKPPIKYPYKKESL